MRLAGAYVAQNVSCGLSWRCGANYETLERERLRNDAMCDKRQTQARGITLQ